MSETLQEMAARLCTEDQKCENCPVGKIDGGYSKCIVLVARNGTVNAEAQLDALRAWAEANPPKTYWSDFCEKFHRAEVLRDIDTVPGCILRIYHGRMSGDMACPPCPPCSCVECWNSALGSLDPDKKDKE